MASFNVSGLVPISAAIAGSEVAITGRIHVLHEQGGGPSGIRRSFDSGKRERGPEPGLYRPLAAQAIAELGKPPKSSVTIILYGY
jgi:hypothetical protein